MGVLRVAAQKQEQQRMATLEILQVILSLCQRRIILKNKYIDPNDLSRKIEIESTLKFSGSMWFG